MDYDNLTEKEMEILCKNIIGETFNLFYVFENIKYEENSLEA